MGALVVPKGMAHQVGSPPSGSSPARPQVIRVPQIANEAPLDLNLSQKVSQNLFKAHDETEVSVSPRKSFEFVANSKPNSVPNVMHNALTLNANGHVNSTGKTMPENTSEVEHGQGHTGQQRPSESAGAIPIENQQNSIVVVEDTNLEVNAFTPAPVGGKRKSSRVEQAAKSGVVTSEDGTSQGNEIIPLPSPGHKRKSPRVKQQNPDSTKKKVILALEANEDDGLPRPRGRPRGSSHISKDTTMDTTRSRNRSSTVTSVTPDLAERRLLLEERKIRLAEQRFALEEKKLEATIEIGKGLIVSMERMTNTISGIGGSSQQL